MFMTKFSDRKKIAWAGLLLSAAATLYVLYAHGYFDWWLGEWSSGNGQFNPAMCGRASMSMESVRCTGRVLYVTLSNTGRMPLNGNFIATISTGDAQTFVANNTESVMKPGQTGSLAFDIGALSPPISKVVVAFQPCGNVVAEKEELAVSCQAMTRR